MMLHYLRLSKQLFIWYSATLLLLFIVAFSLLNFQGFTLSETFNLLGQGFSYLLSEPIPLAILALPFFLFRLFKYAALILKTKGRKVLVHRLLVYLCLPLFVVSTVVASVLFYFSYENFNYQWDYNAENQSKSPVNLFEEDDKQRGVHLFVRHKMTKEDYQPLIKNHIEWVTFVPYTYQPDYDKPALRNRRNANYEGYSRRDSTFLHNIQMAKSVGLKVMLKPHIWMQSASGKWRSDIEMTSETDWEQWFENYEQFILHYAQMAKETEADLFCVGTELQTTIRQKPDKWVELIGKVKLIYSGELTYAANWNSEFEEVAFWDKLDYVGIQAYFPLVENQKPKVKDLMKGWKKHKNALEKYSHQVGKPILFTEVGYKSTADAGIRPWEWVDGAESLVQKLSNETQYNCYKALFQSCWDEPWFKGIHIWKWEMGYSEKWSKVNRDFTPQNKPAQNLIAEWFGKE